MTSSPSSAPSISRPSSERVTMSETLHRAEQPLATVLATAFRRSLGWILALTLLGGVAGAGAALAMPKTYQASTQLILLPVNGKDAMEVNSGTGVAKSLASSYAQATTSTPVLTKALEQAGSTQTVASLEKKVLVSVPDDTVIIDIKVKDATAQGAAALANAISTEFVKQSPELMPKVSSGTTVLQPSVLRPATVPGGPSSLGLRALVPAGLFLGLAAGLCIALLRSRD